MADSSLAVSMNTICYTNLKPRWSFRFGPEPFPLFGFRRFPVFVLSFSVFLSRFGMLESVVPVLGENHDNFCTPVELLKRNPGFLRLDNLATIVFRLEQHLIWSSTKKKHVYVSTDRAIHIEIFSILPNSLLKAFELSVQVLDFFSFCLFLVQFSFWSLDYTA